MFRSISKTKAVADHLHKRGVNAGIKTEQILTELLCELVWYFTAGLKAPRWLRTANSVKFIGEVAV